ncbi:Protein of unknown function [Bacillus mycoides]|nr:Protein of unknown function [Bacillus mycoides]
MLNFHKTFPILGFFWFLYSFIGIIFLLLFLSV